MDNNQNQRNNNPLGDGSNSPRRQNIILLLVAALVTMICMTYFLRAFSENTNQEWTYTQFIEAVDAGKVDSIVITDDRINITLKEDADKAQTGRPGLVTSWGSVSTMTYYTGKAEDDSDLTQRMIEAGVTVSSEVPDNSGVILSFFLYYVAPILLMWLILSLIFRRMGRGGGPLSVGKSNAKIYVQKETGVTFKDVAGEDEAKESLVEVVDFLHNPAKYAKIGAKLPKGALLVGPPGTGKTLLAKAVAGEAHVPFYSLAGSDFIELYVGVGASRVRDLFSEASKNAPCIIFIDEIDAIGRSRDNKYGGGNEEREQTLNQLLSEMDGFDSSKGVLILGATNRPEILDKALLRPGRFDRRIIVDKPDLKGREEILKVHSKDVKMDETVDLKGIALATSGAVGSDLANMINEAAINAVKAHREYVCQQDLMEAVEQVLVGKEKKDRILSKEERKIVSYHEVGHALISAVQKNTEPVQKITIVPRTMGALGYVMQVPEDEKYLQTKDEIIDDIIVSLGGRAAEEVIFNTVTTGAENDIEKATSMARSMITMFGMSDRFGLMQLESVQNRYLDGNRVLNCSDETATLVDAEVQKLLAECYEKAKQIIREHLDAMDKIAQFLIEKETITGKEFMKIYREVENIPEPTQEEMEAAKRGRIYATRAESALVGENVPIKTKEDKAAEQEVSAPGPEAANNEAPQSQPSATDSMYQPGQFQSIFDAQVSDAGVENRSQQNAEDSENQQSSVGSENRGRFSNVPNDFDQKN
ncbi:ATP-dependent zinc metalloprotease FtsH [Butyrivibrio sp. VCB2006]|uniref:ATP-dependent zinc metalloprotease FtsH n=1 Tax=Butyrivibrio sp. VCB2006 TaxID=1280679 RepID=UPI0004084B2B|nr:ATP-dependent zinc metalloprotease FtsH [Butyrivibrio sp. VCB2006]